MCKNTNELLRTQFFPNLHIKQLLDLHQSLEKEFEDVLRFSYQNVYSIFAKYDKQFLIYCNAISKYDITKVFLEDKITYNDDIKILVEKLDLESAFWRPKINELKL